MDLKQETDELTKLLVGKTVRHVRRFRPREVLIEFTDGTRFIADARDAIECSVTTGANSN
jgi:hypothetical protein